MIAISDQPFILRLAAVLLILAGAVLCLRPCPVLASKGLLDEVIALDLGLQGYTIGNKLTPEQEKIAAAHQEDDAHAGTIKFVDGNLHVVVDDKTRRVLALYKREEGAGKKELKAMVAALMDRFDAPTVMAHDKIIYWAFNRHGAITEEDFAKAKKVNQVPRLGIIATVKLNSDLEIMPETKQNGKQTGTNGEEDLQKQTGVIYFIITSDPLVREFLSAQDHK